MRKYGRYRAMLADNIEPYLRDYTRKWTQCSYCGRTVLYSQRMRHTKDFHTSPTGGLIIDF